MVGPDQRISTFSRLHFSTKADADAFIRSLKSQTNLRLYWKSRKVLGLRNPSYTKYGGREGSGNFEPLTIDEAKRLRSGSHVWFYTAQGDAKRAKVNGKPKTWKRSPERVEVPLKYGLYEYATFDENDIANGRLLREV